MSSPEAKGAFQRSARIWVALDRDFIELVYDSGVRQDIVSTGFELPIVLAPMTPAQRATIDARLRQLED